jgi:hypothetical protein
MVRLEQRLKLVEDRRRRPEIAAQAIGPFWVGAAAAAIR